MRIDHVQLAMPPGGEDSALAFYGGLLGMTEERKPPELAGRGGCWFRAGAARLHLGVEADFRPARKAHPALRVAAVEELLARLRAAGVVVTEDGSFEGSARAYASDPFGNRLELIAE